MDFQYKTGRFFSSKRTYASATLASVLFFSASSVLANNTELSNVFATWVKLRKSGANTVVEYRPGSFNFNENVAVPSEYKTNGMSDFESLGPTKTLNANPDEILRTVTYTKSLDGNITHVNVRTSHSSSSLSGMAQAIRFATGGELETGFNVGEHHASKTNGDDNDPLNDKIVVPVYATVRDGRTSGSNYGFLFKYLNKSGNYVGLGTGQSLACSRGEAVDFMGIGIIQCSNIDKGKTKVKLVRIGGGSTDVDLSAPIDIDATDVCIQQSSSAGSESSCTDNIDNDDNGFTDCADSVCTSDPACNEQSSSNGSYEYSCTDGTDNDNNGFTDCGDSVCSTDPACTEQSSSESSSSEESSSSSSGS